MSFKIEKDVPMPGLNRKVGIAEAIRAMEIGDSVLDPCDGLDVTKQRHRQTNWVTQAKENGRRVATRRVEGGVRVWRIA